MEFYKQRLSTPQKRAGHEKSPVLVKGPYIMSERGRARRYVPYAKH